MAKIAGETVIGRPANPVSGFAADQPDESQRRARLRM